MAPSITKSGLCTISAKFGLYEFGHRTINDDCGLRVASLNIKVGLRTVTTKFGLRAIATLYEFGLCEFGRVASNKFGQVASIKFVASHYAGGL